MARLIPIILFILIVSSSVSALWNDLGNDSCLTIYSDKKEYVINELRPFVETEITIDNQCGQALEDVDLGLFLPNSAINTKFKQALLWKPTQYEWIQHSLTCPYDYNKLLNQDTDRNPHLATCFIADTNGISVIWEHEYQTLDKKTQAIIYESYELISDAHWVDITQALINSVDIANIEINRENWFLKAGWKDITIPIGEKKIKLIFEPSAKTSGEFIIAGRSASNNLYYSVLDPDWYNESWLWRAPINLTLNENANKFDVIKIDNVDISAWTTCADLNDVWIVNDTNTIDLNRLIDKQGSNIDIYFELEQARIAGTYDDIYYIYYNNSSCPTPKIETCRGKCDKFEDGDYSTNPAWTVESGTITTATGVTKDGMYALRLDNTGSPEPFINTATSINDINFYVRNTSIADYYLTLRQTGDTYGALFAFRQNTFKCSTAGGIGSYTTFSTTPLANTWYLVNIQSNGTDANFCIYNTDGIQIECKLNQGNWETGSPSNFRAWMANATGNYGYIDMIMYAPTVNATTSAGTSEQSTKTYDFTISLPSTGCVETQGSTDASEDCERCYAEATDTLPPIDTGDLNCQGQNVGTGTAFILINFTGNATTFDLNMDLNASTPDGIAIKAKCNSGDSTDAITLTTTQQTVCNDITPSGTADANIFVWVNFTNYTISGDLNGMADVNINSE